MKKWKIPDCRLKGYGTKQIQDNYVLTWSGVNTQEKVIHRVAFVMQPDRANKVLETDFVSERTVKTRIKYEHSHMTIIQIYAPYNDTYSKEEKADFLRNYLAQLTLYQTTMISSSWETSMEGWVQEEHHGEPTSAHTATPIQNVTAMDSFVLSMVFGSQTPSTIIGKAKDRHGTHGTTSPCHLRLISS